MIRTQASGATLVASFGATASATALALLAAIALAPYHAFAADPPFPAQLNLADLTPDTGAILLGIDNADDTGWDVRGIGDFNGDGLLDFAIGAPHADPSGAMSAGRAYVVFGRAARAGQVRRSLGGLTGPNGFSIDGLAAFDTLGITLAAGDVNGDGFADLVIGAPGVDLGTGRSNAGAAYVIFGGRLVGHEGSIDLTTLDGRNGFALLGSLGGDAAGSCVSVVGDLNRDGFDDVLIGAPQADPGQRSNAGAAYVVFGRADFTGLPSIELSSLDGVNGFRMEGVATNDLTGSSASLAGDVNADTFDDLILGAPGGLVGVGRAFVLFGSLTVGSANGGVISLATLNGTTGTSINGIDPGDQAGAAVSAGDVNLDGISDLAVGAPYGDPNGRSNAGEAYVVFGASGFGAGGTVSLASLSRTTGRLMRGEVASDHAGAAISMTGDINGDRFADILIGAFASDVSGSDSGRGYIVYGGRDFGGPGPLDLLMMTASDGFKLNGIAAQEHSAFAVDFLGDANGDGLHDLILGSPAARTGGSSFAGAAFVVFGRRNPEQIVLEVGPLVRGERTRMRVTLADPGETVVILYSRTGTRDTYVGSLGISIDLAPPISALPRLTADATGTALLDRTIPPATPAGPIWLQAVIQRAAAPGSVKSNLVATAVQ